MLISNFIIAAIIFHCNFVIEQPAPFSAILESLEQESYIDQINLRSQFFVDVSEYKPEESYAAWAQVAAVSQLKFATGEPANQYLVFIDRNPKRQLAMVGYYEAQINYLFIVGWDKCSTGDPKHGRDYHYTPTGVFVNTLTNHGFRAAGTKNSKGWRGYGKKNCRVWDFGYQATTKPIKGQEQAREIRLLMHATDLDYGEPKLGTPQSKGCVRISAKLNRFLDIYGIIDSEYEADVAGKPAGWLLLKNRTPVKEAGKYLIIGDSAGN